MIILFISFLFIFFELGEGGVTSFMIFYFILFSYFFELERSASNGV